MTNNNSSIPESIENSTSLIINVSENEGQLIASTPDNSGKTLPQIALTQTNKNSSAQKALQGLGDNLFKGVWQLGGGAASKVAAVSGGVVKSAKDLGQGTIKSAADLGKGAVNSVAEFGQGVADSAAKLGQEATKSALSQEPVRELLTFVVNNTQASQVAKEALVEAHIKQVNLINIDKFVAVLKEKFSGKSLEEIAQQVVVQQTLRITGNSAAISLIPGKLAESMGFDQASLSMVQVETIYEISKVYEFDLNSPERKEEALAIFDRVFRSSRQMKMSMNIGVVPTLPIMGGLLSAIPILGGVLNVGSDAFLISLIGDISCQLYKAIAEEDVMGSALMSFRKETQIQYKQRLW